LGRFSATSTGSSARVAESGTPIVASASEWLAVAVAAPHVDSARAGGIVHKKAVDTLGSPLVQYSLGLALNVMYLAALTVGDTSRYNLQPPEGIYSFNLWRGSDVLTYVAPARNFLEYHTFGVGPVADFHRTVGYPLFLAGMMRVFGSHWVMATLFVQAAIFALIYPTLLKTAAILLDASDDVVAWSFVFIITAGTYVAMVPVILTDLFFTVLFTLGVYFGLQAITRNSWFYLALQIVFIGYAGQVRPVLALYCVPNVVLMLFQASKHHGALDRKVRRIIAVSSICVVLTGNLPSLRNYINHGFLMPSDVLSINMFDYLAYRVLRFEGELDEYDALRVGLKVAVPGQDLMDRKQRAALNVFRQYPVATLMEMGRNGIGIMARSHWAIAAQFWGYNFQDQDVAPPEVGHFVKSEVVVGIERLFNVVYLMLYVLCAGYSVRLWKLRQFMLVGAVMLMAGYLLIPTFMVHGAGSRFRLPMEGLLVAVAFLELEVRLQSPRDGLSQARSRREEDLETRLKQHVS